jgi:hypothetical protein
VHDQLKRLSGKLMVCPVVGDAMRFASTAAILWLALSSPAFATTIAPGMKFKAVKAALQKHGYEVDARKHGLAIDSGDSNEALDFCRIDSEVTLVVGYDLHHDVVTALELYFIPEGRTTKTQTVVRAAVEIELEEDGVYALKLKRRDAEPKAAD